MKANEAKSKFVYPDKLYARCKDNKTLDISYAPQTLEAVEYVRTDAFIEKACSWLKNHYRDYMYNPTGKRLEAFFGGDMCNDFEDYMKGE